MSLGFVILLNIELLVADIEHRRVVFAERSPWADQLMLLSFFHEEAAPQALGPNGGVEDIVNVIHFVQTTLYLLRGYANRLSQPAVGLAIYFTLHVQISEKIGHFLLRGFPLRLKEGLLRGCDL